MTLDDQRLPCFTAREFWQYPLAMAWMTKTALFLLLVAASTWMHSAITLPAQIKSTIDRIHAPWVSCYDKNGKNFIGPKDERTPMLTSPNKIYRGYAEIHAQANAGQCRNRADLFISTRGAPFKLVFTQMASEKNGTATSLGPVGWSPDSRWLVVERGLLFYESDSGGIGLLLYDTQSGKVSTPEVETAIQNTLRKRCALRYGIMGFDGRNRVKLRVTDWVDELGDRQSQCIRGAAAWLFDPISLTALAAQSDR